MRSTMRIAGICCAFISAGWMAVAQSDANARWVGIWESQLDGQPGAILTLADDNGAIEGTLVLNIIRSDGEPAHIIAHEVHALMHPKLQGSTLTFNVKQINRSGKILSFTALLTDSQTAKLHCSNCSDAPVVAMTKEQ